MHCRCEIMAQLGHPLANLQRDGRIDGGVEIPRSILMECTVRSKRSGTGNFGGSDTKEFETRKIDALIATGLNWAGLRRLRDDGVLLSSQSEMGRTYDHRKFAPLCPKF